MLFNQLNASMPKISMQKDSNEVFSQVLLKSYMNLHIQKGYAFVLNALSNTGFILKI